MINYSFRNDYSEGAHQNILDALNRTNFVQEEGYGKDDLCNEAIKLIRKKIQNPKADVHFVSGGTQANAIVISSILKPYESIIAATTGHIAVHEAGAIESTGHKINTIETEDGKLCPENIKAVIDIHTDEHIVRQRAVLPPEKQDRF